MQKLEGLLRLLSDGQFHSGAALGGALGIGRSAVWKQVRAVEALGIEVHALRGKGYRLARPLELLDADVIRAALKSPCAARLGDIELFPCIDSTNRHLMDRAAAGLAGPHVCLAECQTAGRGRRGRTWVSPFGRNLYLSMLWRFEVGADALPALSLAVGVAIARALEDMDVGGLGIKWPNDLYHDGKKIGGLLIELAGEASGPWDAVVGVGLNVDMSVSDDAAIDQPWTDLRTALGRSPGRNRVAAAVIDALLTALGRFEQGGFAEFRDAFARFDLTRGREVELHHGAHDVRRGRSLGVSEHGALLVECEGGVRQVTSGEISLRISR